ncbi:MAG: PIN domain-containing protein [Methylacidiphilales bacterium]|nr:PIN domain-containing protein [Candidatus Methylacidiphilales bacterium]
MRQSVFLDSSAIYALADGDDSAHGKVVECYTKSRYVITHQAVLMEAFSLISKRLHRVAAVEWIGALRHSPKIEVFTLDKDLIDGSWARCVKYADKEWDWIDCASFELMERRGIKSALALDQHFRQAGFRLMIT